MASVLAGSNLAVAAPATASASGSTAASAQAWLTTPDRSNLLARKADLAFAPTGSPTIRVDASQRFQSVDGFGAALTGSSAWLLNSVLSPKRRTAALRDLFDPAAGAGLSYIRLPVGSTDFSLSSYTYDDMPPGQRDPGLTSFSIAPDLRDIVPVLKAALQLNPRIKVMATPWSAPAWMKTSGSLIGGTLDPASYAVYAQYLVRFVNAYAAQGVVIDALTVQNEPEFSPPGYPGMTLTPDQEATFIKNHLGPAFAAAGLPTKIIGFDGNWDSTSYPLGLLADPAARQYLSGTAFHCYGGDPASQSQVHNAYPDKGIYFTECSGGDWAPDFAGNLWWNTHNLTIGATRNWARTVLLWNLALDQNNGPTNGGCTNCRGVVTVNRKSGGVTRNVEYYALAHLAKFVVPGAMRIASTALNAVPLESVAFQNTNGSTTLLLLNSAGSSQSFTVDTGKGFVSGNLPSGAVMTLTWP